MNDKDYMLEALSVARDVEQQGEVPIGAVVVHLETGKILSKAGNQTRTLYDPSAHAEVLAIRQACSLLNSQRIPMCDLYVTLEPCTMCAAAISFARIRRLVIGALDEKGGGVLNGIRFFEQKTCHHKKIEIVSGIMQEECSQVLKDFFKNRR